MKNRSLNPAKFCFSVLFLAVAASISNLTFAQVLSFSGPPSTDTNLNLLDRTWRSKSGKYSFTAKLVSSTDTTCTLASDVRETEVEIRELCELDQIIVEAVFGIPLSEASSINAILSPASTLDASELSSIRNSLRELKLAYLLKTKTSFETKDGKKFFTNQITSLSPRYVEIMQGTKSKLVSFTRLTSQSQKLFCYSKKDASDYISALSKMKRRRRKAELNYFKYQRKLPSLKDNPTKISSQSFGLSLIHI